MAKITKPQEKAPASIQGARIGSGGNSQAAIGQATVTSGQQQQRLGQKFVDQANQAMETAIYSNAINSATEQYMSLENERLQKTVDDDGNPNFGSLVTDVTTIGTSVKNLASASITNPRIKQKFEQNFGNFLTNKQIAAQSIARRQQVDFIQSSILRTLNNFTESAATSSIEDMGHYRNEVQELLNDALASGSISHSEKLQFEEKFRKDVAITRTRRMIDEQPTSALGLLSDIGQELGLTERERLSLKNEAEREVKRIEREEKATYVNHDRMVKKLHNDIYQMIETNQKIPRQMMDTLLANARTPAQQAQADHLLKLQKINNNFIMADLLSQEAFLRSQKGKNLNAAQRGILNVLEKSNKNLNRDLEKKPVELMVGLGVVENPQPLSFEGDIVNQLKARVDISNKAAMLYGKEISGFTQLELDLLSEKLNNSSAKEQSEIFNQVVQGMGSKANNLFKELKVKGSDIFSVAGALHVDAQPDVSMKILRGREIKNESKDFTPDKAIFEEELLDLLPRYANIDQHRDSVAAIELIYHDLAFSKGVRETDENLIEEAVNLFTNGGAIEYNDSVVEPPIKGMDDDGFEEWINGLSLEQINSLGGIPGIEDMQQKELTDLLNDAQFINIGRGRYSIFVPVDTGILPLIPGIDQTYKQLLNSDQEPFELDYNELQGNELTTSSDSVMDTSTLDQLEKEFQAVEEEHTHNHKAEPLPEIHSGQLPVINKNVRLKGVNPQLMSKAQLVINDMRALGWDAVIASGVRTQAEQDEKVRKGFSKTRHSKHLHGHALDIVDRSLGWKVDTSHQYWQDLGRIAKKHGLKWGGDWKNFKDVAHIHM